jgi:hypothetical protein
MRLTIILLLISYANILCSQENTLGKSESKLYKFSEKWSKTDKKIDTWVYTKHRLLSNGFLYDVSDSTISTKYKKDSVIITNYSDITRIVLREDNRKRRFGFRALIIGAPVGILSGIILFNTSDYQLGAFPVGFIAGAGLSYLVGLTLGSLKVVIPIKSSKVNKERLKSLSMNK